MIKNYNLLILIFSTLFSYGQSITFQQNTSAAAKKFKLVQKLNKTGDSLILATDNEKIKEVDILNADYLETIEINNSNGKINLRHLTIGNYVVQAKIGTHWIVMYLEKRDLKAEGIKTTDVNIEGNVGITISKNSMDSLSLPKEHSNKLHLDDNEMYWAVYESNTGFSSQRTMSLKFPEEIYDLIYRIELEMKSKVGKDNTLQVYEVFNKPNFMFKQLNNKNYYKSKSSEHFNVEPLYNSEEKKKT
ncbi:hypothetical protein ADIWIN_1990 [Winogradskyella psychrotolerans RS-3]|uniref:Uncharacterized protein n=1 Tax=Winogradskyella psychrotolerans RS-3 TaxID=641526 RepID=S7VU65_9FLAO|nr:hypothetical protein [Winogradskyella psychrotolerans]EPR72902.1 hypothetical protein ADIWIN_1990 [Winogradskyella psychrotolerans RS-3]